MNFERYPWLKSLASGCGDGGSSAAAAAAAEQPIKAARDRYWSTGAVTFPDFIDPSVLPQIVEEVTAGEDGAFTTDDVHTPHQLQVDAAFDPPNSVRNFTMRTRVASVAYDELPTRSELAALYEDPALLALVSAVTAPDVGDHDDGNGCGADAGAGRKRRLYLSDDPLGRCSVNVFRPGYAHAFHFDESEFSTTIMLREADVPGTGLFQYTPPLRRDADDLALDAVASVIRAHCRDDPDVGELIFAEGGCCEVGGGVVAGNGCDGDEVNGCRGCGGGSIKGCPPLHTLDFRPGTLSIFSGLRSLHRVTRVEGSVSRLTAVLTYASQPGFRNSAEVQRMFWGRSSSSR